MPSAASARRTSAYAARRTDASTRPTGCRMASASASAGSGRARRSASEMRVRTRRRSGDAGGARRRPPRARQGRAPRAHRAAPPGSSRPRASRRGQIRRSPCPSPSATNRSSSVHVVAAPFRSTRARGRRRRAPARSPPRRRPECGGSPSTSATSQERQPSPPAPPGPTSSGRCDDGRHARHEDLDAGVVAGAADRARCPRARVPNPLVKPHTRTRASPASPSSSTAAAVRGSGEDRALIGPSVPPATARRKPSMAARRNRRPSVPPQLRTA